MPEERPRTPDWRLVGPGLVVAATGVGAGDLAATLVAGSSHGTTLLWAAIVGCVVKVGLAEAVGRWHLATGQSLFAGWRQLGRWTLVWFAAYVVLWGFVYGAAAMTACGLPLAALFPALSVRAWGVLCALVGLGLVWRVGYAVVEKVMTVLVGLMFVTVVGLAIRVAPDLGEVARGLAPRVPDGAFFYTLGLIGGVGGTITLAAYGYWLEAKGWRDPSWIPMMRLDNRVAYATTGVFVIAMLIVGAELLHASRIALASGDRGLLDLHDVLADRFGVGVARLFLVGFFATSFSSLLGVWHGVSLLFADFVAHLRPGVARGEGSPAFRAYALWLTFPPMALLFLDRPWALIVAYGVLGAFFLPFLSLTLLWLLNTERTPAEWRSGIASNVLLGLAALLFGALCVQELRSLLG